MTTPERRALTEDLAQQVHMTAHAWRVALDRRLRPLGLSRATWMLLAYVRKLDNPIQSALAEHMGLEGASVVRLVDRLEREGLVERRGGVDRRVKNIHLTAKGEALSGEIWRVAGAMRLELFDGVPDMDLAQVSVVLNRLHARLDEIK